MNFTNIRNLIAFSNWPALQKAATLGFIDRMDEAERKRQEDRLLIEEIGKVDNISEVILSTDDMKIFSVRPSKLGWDEKYPYRSIYRDEKLAWNRVGTVSPSFEIAFLVCLQHKQLGANSQFAEFAVKMLNIPNIEE